MTEMDEERTLEALEALGGWTCANCGAEMRDSAYCDACCYLYCPYCRMPSDGECRHLITIADPDCGVNPSPFKGLELPHLPERDAGYWPDDWSESVLQQAFGPLCSLLEAYFSRDGLEFEPNEYLLWQELRLLLSEVPASLNRFVPSHPGHSYYEDAFVEDQDATRSEIAEIVSRLRDGFERLTSAYEQSPESLSPTG